MARVRKDRNGDRTDRPLFKASTTKLRTLSINDPGGRKVYEDVFESKFLQETINYYEREIKEVLRSNNAETLLNRVEHSLAEEAKLVEACMDKSTLKPLTKALEKHLITDNVDTILELEVCGLIKMINNNNVAGLKRLFLMLKRADDGVTKLSDKIGAHLIREGKELLDNASEEGTKTAIKLVNEVLALKEKYDKLLTEAFDNDGTCRRAFYSAYTSIVNTTQVFPEYLSLFIDDRLKRGCKDMSEAEIEEVFDKSINLFRLLSEKDIFERYYKVHLSKRLLTNKASSDDTERGILTRLKQECGTSFTYKLEGMFKDIQLSTSIVDDFKSRRLDQGYKFDLGVRVLTSVFWATDRTATCGLPKELNPAVDAFTKFYCETKHQGRTLNWYPTTASLDLEGRFEKRKYIILASQYQGVTLVTFNAITTAGFSFQDLVDKTGMSELELKRALTCLIFGKFKLLVKQPASKKFDENDRFFVNDAFSSKFTRIKIQQIASKEVASERTITRSRVETDRRYQIEACIVRVMKARQTLNHNDLVVEVIKQLSARFTPTPQLLKKRIEHLIDRDYMARAETNRNVYNYVA